MATLFKFLKTHQARYFFNLQISQQSHTVGQKNEVDQTWFDYH